MTTTTPNPDFTPIAPIDLGSQYQRLKAEIDERIATVLTHGRFILGPEVAAFEAEIARFCGARHAVGVSSGRDALVIALWAQGIGPGDAVFVPAFTFAATAGAVVSAGASPVFVDVDPQSFLMDPDDLEKAIERTSARGDLRPRAVMPVDLFGIPADYRAIQAVAASHGLSVVADAAQSVGGSQDGKPVGSLAPVTATSFFPTKPLGAYGDGGCLLTDDDAQAALFRSIRVHGQDGDDEQRRKGMTGRLDTMQAAILSAKLAVFPDELDARERVAQAYDAGLGDHVSVPFRPAGTRSAWAQYTIMSDRRDAIEAALAEAKVTARVYYRRGLHLHEGFRDHSDGPGSLPVTEALAGRVLSLPMHPYLTGAEVDRVIDVVRHAAS